MPVYLRRFYFSKLVDAKKTEKEQIEKTTKKEKSNQVFRPNISPKFKR